MPGSRSSDCRLAAFNFKSELSLPGMKLSTRWLRRIIVLAVFLAVFFFTGLGLKRAVTPVPSCTDGIKNGEEEGIDCGLYACGNYCEPDLDPPKIISTKLIKAGEGDYDFVADIENPHAQFGASEVAYKLTLFNSEDIELDNYEGIFYILPGQTKHLVITHLTTEKNIQRIDFKIESAKWQKLDSLEGMNLIIKRQNYVNLSGSSGTSLDAAILNDSDFDLEIVNVDVVLYNSQGEIAAVNRSDIRTFLARTERSFKVIWPFKIPDKIAKIEIFPSTNLFENSNYIKAYGSAVQKFQQY